MRSLRNEWGSNTRLGVVMNSIKSMDIRGAGRVAQAGAIHHGRKEMSFKMQRKAYKDVERLLPPSSDV